MAWQTPKTDWTTNPKSPMAVDLNRIEGNIEYLIGEVDKKQIIVDAINTMGQSATIENTHAQLAQKIKDVSKDANATPDDALLGKTFYSGGVKEIGNIPSKGSQVYIPTTADQVIPAKQYLSGAQTIKGDPNLKPENIREGKEIFGVPGAVEPVTYESGSKPPASYISIRGLSFKPRIIKVQYSYWVEYGGGNADRAMYEAVYVTGTNLTRYQLGTGTPKLVGDEPFDIYNDGFYCGMEASSSLIEGSITWEAWR